jgi:hypothetical protein
MKSFCITYDNINSKNNYKSLVNSSEVVLNKFLVESFPATTLNNAKMYVNKYALEWGWPENKEVADMTLGIIKKPYEKRTINDLVCESLTHYRIWDYCVETQESVLVLDNSMRFTKTFDLEEKTIKKYDVIGINNPKYCMEDWRLYLNEIIKNKNDIQMVPSINPVYIPRTIASPKSYIVTPKGAEKLLQNADDNGLWPVNESLSKQVLGNVMVTKKFYTKLDTRN